MINIYNWSYEVDKNLVRIEYSGPIKTKLQSAIKKFNGQPMPVKTRPNEFIVKFKNTRVVNDFITFTLEQYPNFFSLKNNWDITKSSENTISLTAMKESSNSIADLSEILCSFLADSNTISNLTRNEIFDIQINVDATICYISFSIKFATDTEAQDFLMDFIKFKAH